MKKLLLGSIALLSITAATAASGADALVKLPPPPPISWWEVETGARVWFSTGNIGAPNPLFDPGNSLLSRLLYKDERGISGELFARLDHSSGFFVKGNAGLGRITGGNMYDEDFPVTVRSTHGAIVNQAYSDTLQNNNIGHLYYGTIDGGYNFLMAPEARIGTFVGYNYYGQHVDTFGCTQLAGSGICAPAAFPAFFKVAAFFNGISEDDAFGSLRVGLSYQFMLTDRLKLTADMAYLPWVNFWGVDNHNARGLIINESASQGDGVQVEAVLSYAVTDNINIGVGGRYWTWNMRNGNTLFNFTAPPSQFNEPARFNSERYGVFAQTSYHWGDVTPAAKASAEIYKAPPPVALVPGWTGFYFGGHVGSGVGDDSWSDRFGNNFVLGIGAVNIAGFGDTTHASGPLAGGQIGINFHPGSVVLGIEADASAADLRGETTCFSGLGGVNCQRLVNALATLTGRAGLTWGRSLLYIKGGGAWSNTTYNINANTAFIALGTGSVNVNTLGWTAGAGLEYAVNAKWSGKLEYDYLSFASSAVTFNTVAVIAAQPTNVKQNLHVVKLGVNYKLN